MSKKICRLNHEYPEIINEQIHFLIKSSEEFDNGYFSESKRLATTMRVLLHDTCNSTSLLTQLKIKNSIKYYNTAYFLKDGATTYIGPISTVTIPDKHVLNASGYLNTYLPVLDEMKNDISDNWLEFDLWWSQEIFIMGGISFTRREFVLFLANQDGGSHVDPKLDEKYQSLTKNTYSFFGKYEGLETPIPFVNLHLAMTRQIAHEVLITLKKYCKFSEKYEPVYRSSKEGNICPIEVSHLAINLGKEFPFLKRP